MVVKILFQNNYPISVKLFIDFFILCLTFYVIDTLLVYLFLI